MVYTNSSKVNDINREKQSTIVFLGKVKQEDLVI